MHSSNESIDEYLAKLDHSHLELIKKTRTIIFEASKQINENIKWSAPNYFIGSKDILTFNLRNFKCLALIFHTGTKGKDEHTGVHPITDATGLLEWLSDQRAVMRITSEEMFLENREKIKKLIIDWIIFNTSMEE